MDFIFTRVMMLILVNLLISVSLRIQWTLHGILNSDMEATWMHWDSMMQVTMLIGWQLVFLLIIHRKILKTASSFSVQKIYLKRNK